MLNLDNFSTKDSILDLKMSQDHALTCQFLYYYPINIFVELSFEHTVWIWIENCCKMCVFRKHCFLFVLKLEEFMFSNCMPSVITFTIVPFALPVIRQIIFWTRHITVLNIDMLLGELLCDILPKKCMKFHWCIQFLVLCHIICSPDMRFDCYQLRDIMGKRDINSSFCSIFRVNTQNIKKGWKFKLGNTNKYLSVDNFIILSVVFCRL